MSMLFGKSAIAVSLYIMALLFEAGVRIFTPLAIAKDAKSLGIKRKTAWIVLSVFQPFIVGIIYLCCRKKVEKIVPKICKNCGITVSGDITICPTCACVQFDDYSLPTKEQDKKTAKMFLGFAIVCLSLSVAFSVFYAISSYSLVDYLEGNSDSIIEEFEDDIDDYDEDDGSDTDDDFERDNPIESFS